MAFFRKSFDGAHHAGVPRCEPIIKSIALCGKDILWLGILALVLLFLLVCLEKLWRLSRRIYRKISSSSLPRSERELESKSPGKVEENKIFTPPRHFIPEMSFEQSNRHRPSTLTDRFDAQSTIIDPEDISLREAWYSSRRSKPPFSTPTSLIGRAVRTSADTAVYYHETDLGQPHGSSVSLNAFFLETPILSSTPRIEWTDDEFEFSVFELDDRNSLHKKPNMDHD